MDLRKLNIKGFRYINKLPSESNEIVYSNKSNNRHISIIKDSCEEDRLIVIIKYEDMITKITTFIGNEIQNIESWLNIENEK